MQDETGRHGSKKGGAKACQKGKRGAPAYVSLTRPPRRAASAAPAPQAAKNNQQGVEKEKVGSKSVVHDVGLGPARKEGVDELSKNVCTGGGL